uniref:Ribonuclease A-domain domain-containing protein n=1 Tax=Oreochromis niloticus TaxID=8128 RepID=A0A669D6N4_ORENI
MVKCFRNKQKKPRLLYISVFFFCLQNRNMKNITDVNGENKSRNTFIISTFKEVKDICKKKRVYKYDNLYRSSEEMKILYCKLQREKKTYEDETIKKHIEIACVKIGRDLKPVHFECCC